MKCKFTKPDGTACNINAMKNSGFCWHHSPDVNDQDKHAALSRGGKTKKNKLIIHLPELKIENTKDLPPFLIDTIRNVRSGILSAKIGSVIGYLSGILLRSYEISDLNARIEKLEQLISSSFVEVKEDA